MLTKNDSAAYLAFLKKFEAKKTTDDCYTPPNIYDVVQGWVSREYGLEGREVVRPFHPEGDYQRYDYPKNCVVIDNPPFSILAEIVRWYDWQKIDYFLFAPNLTLFSADAPCSIISDSNITYDNGARVKTSFVTNLDASKIRTAPELHWAIRKQDDINRALHTRTLPRFVYPKNVTSAALLSKYARAHLKIMPQDVSSLVQTLDHQREHGKSIFGGGYILSDRAVQAIEITALEAKGIELAAKDYVWELSAREKAEVERLNSGAPLPEQGDLL